jgi:lysozyme
LRHITKIVEEHYGITPILYTYNKFYTAAIADDPRFAKYPVWIAWYTTKGDPSDIKEDWVFWQYTDKGSLSGIKGNVDVNVFNGGIQDLDGLRKKERGFYFFSILFKISVQNNTKI